MIASLCIRAEAEILVRAVKSTWHASFYPCPHGNLLLIAVSGGHFSNKCPALEQILGQGKHSRVEQILERYPHDGKLGASGVALKHEGEKWDFIFPPEWLMSSPFCKPLLWVH